jgi:hypothetical protein
MFIYTVSCALCGNNPVYEAAFKTELTESDLNSRKPKAICTSCTPSYIASLKNKTPLDWAALPLFKLKETK